MENQEQETVTISAEEYNNLLVRAEWLEYLEEAGVDNWDGYDYACDLAREQGFFDEEDIDVIGALQSEHGRVIEDI
jgi:hypothetical protein